MKKSKKRKKYHEKFGKCVVMGNYWFSYKFKVSLHWLIYKDAYGAEAMKGMHIHHIDCDSLNNRLSNLIAIPPGFHQYIHIRMRELETIFSREEILERLNFWVEEPIANQSGTCSPAALF